MTMTLDGSSGTTFPAGGVGNPTSTVVGISDTQTLTNKTLTSPTISSPTISGTPVMSASVLTLGTAVALSGTAVGFTSIPSWVKRITVMLYNGVSTTGTSMLQLQIGSGSYTTSGYTCSYGVVVTSSTTNITTAATGFVIYNDNAPDARNGTVTFNLATGNTWVVNGMCGVTNRGIVSFTTGYLALGGALDRIQLTTVNGTDTFDAGSINIQYE